MMHLLYNYLSILTDTGGNGYTGVWLSDALCYLLSFIVSFLVLFIPFGIVIKLIKGVFSL